MNKQNKFSLKKRLHSFGFAGEGLLAFFKAEHNAIIHLVATIAVIVAGFIFHITMTEAAILTLAIGSVWVAEIFNTVIERVMDIYSMEKKPAVKTIKDISAAAVLLVAIAAFIVGCFIFIPKL